MATQVKFYQVSALPETPDNGGLYFVKDGDTNFGQLYKGSMLVGAARVTEGDTYPTSPIRGDINISSTKGAEIYMGDGEGEGWKALTDASLTQRVQNLEAVVSYSGGDGAKVVTADTITATTGNFTNLNVSDTATFSATTVDATTLSVKTEDAATFGSATISAIADREALAKIAAIAEASASASDDGV